tara:strand:- start:266 stop:931 length:666 start_codon:yes stop_codon:yes gene_type:complete
MREIFLDTETTGLSPNDNHKIVEIACIETEDLIPTKKVFHKLVNPQRDVPVEAFRIHGFSTEFLSNKEIFANVADEFLDFIKEKKLIIHNAPFDLGFLNFELRLLKKNEIKKDYIIDSLDLARSKYPGTTNSLDALCRKFNIDLSRRKKHNALLDCELLREVYVNLLGVKEPTLNFTHESNSTTQNKNQLGNYCKKTIKLTANEIEKHKNFLQKNLKKNFY